MLNLTIHLSDLKQFLTGSYNRIKDTNILSNFANLSSIQLSNILLLIIIFPIITHKIGIEAFGFVMLANSFSSLAGIIVNYGTNQTGIRDIAGNLRDPEKLRAVFYNTLWIRLLFFIAYILVVYIMQWFNIKYYLFILYAIPLVLSEVLNPLFFFIGIEKLKFYNISNLASKVLSIILLIFFIKDARDAEWVNFIMGMATVVTFSYLLLNTIPKFRFSFQLPVKTDILRITRDNFYLTINNISTNLQQSIIIFALAKWGNASWLGAYTLCDKVVGSSRILLITVSNAVYPKSAQLYKESNRLWKVYRQRMQFILAGIFFVGSVLLFFFAGFAVRVLSGEENETAIIYLRTMALFPAISALNVLNVLDQLLKNNSVYIFRIAMIMFAFSVALAFLLLHYANYKWFGSFTVIIELCALFMYQYVVKKPAIQNV